MKSFQKKKLDFSLCRTFNLDEYVGVPAENKHSYRYYMNEHLFSKINIDLRNTHLPDGTAQNLQAEGEHYEKLIEDVASNIQEKEYYRWIFANEPEWKDYR